jgi:hypothetical protein
MSALWIRYEMTYDSFHKNADRIYCVNISDSRENIPAPLVKYFKSVFPEIANAVVLVPTNIDFEYEKVSHKADCLIIDSSFFSIFNVRIVEGSMDFLIPRSNKIAITREKALQLFGNENPVGKKLYTSEDYCEEICAVVTGLPKRSNYPFDLLRGTTTDIDNEGSYFIGNILVELVPGIDMKIFEKKLYEHEISIPWISYIKNMTIIPLTSVRYKDPNIERDVRFQHIIIFALVGLLLILCTLFNYLVLFVSRFGIRRRELALRTVYGASVRSLFAMLSVEFLISLIVALVAGLALINIFSPFFLKVSGVRLELSSIYLESIIYMAGIIVIALTVFLLTLVIFKHRTLDSSIRSNIKIFRKASIIVQLTVSIILAFRTLIILKQMYYLHNSTDLGFSFKNCGSMYYGHNEEEVAALNNKIKQIPEIKETIIGLPPLLPVLGRSPGIICDWDGKQADVKCINIYYAGMSEKYAKFYEIELMEGEFLGDDISEYTQNPQPVLIN